MVVITQDVPSRDVVWNEDYYIHRTDRDYWTGHNLVGVVDQLKHFAHLIDCVRVGWDMDTVKFQAMIREATIEMRGK